jgi:hypothetical protein
MVKWAKPVTKALPRLRKMGFRVLKTVKWVRKTIKWVCKTILSAWKTTTYGSAMSTSQFEVNYSFRLESSLHGIQKRNHLLGRSFIKPSILSLADSQSPPILLLPLIHALICSSD